MLVSLSHSITLSGLSARRDAPVHAPQLIHLSLRPFRMIISSPLSVSPFYNIFASIRQRLSTTSLRQYHKMDTTPLDLEATVATPPIYHLLTPPSRHPIRQVPNVWECCQCDEVRNPLKNEEDECKKCGHRRYDYCTKAVYY